MKLFLLIPWLLFSALHMQQKKKVIFFGDSITELGVRPGGYIRDLDTLQQKAGLNYEIEGEGIGGNKVYDLYLRMQEDVLDKKPDVVVIWIGVNDVWHKRLLGTGTDADKFQKFYQAIIRKMQDQKIKVILCTPAVIGEKKDMTNELDGDLNKYAAIIRQLAVNNNCGLVDLRKAFLEKLQQINPDNKDRGILTNDGVHLNLAGNQFVAELILEKL